MEKQNQCVWDNAAFLQRFPAFGCLASEAPGMAEQVFIENDCFNNIRQPKKKILAWQLMVAHYLTVETNINQGFGGVLKSISNRHDKIDFESGNVTDPYGLNTTIYGQRYKRLIKKNYKGGFIARSNQSKSLMSNQFYRGGHH